MHVIIVMVCAVWMVVYVVSQLRDTARDDNRQPMHSAHLFKIESTETGRVIGFDIYSNPSPAAHGPYRYRQPAQPYAVTHGETLASAEHSLVKAILDDIEDPRSCSWPADERELLLAMIEHRQRSRPSARPTAAIVNPRRSLDPTAPVLLLADVRRSGLADASLLTRIEAELRKWPSPVAVAKDGGTVHVYPVPQPESYPDIPPEAWPVHAVVAVGPLGVALLHADSQTLRLLDHQQWPLETPVAAGVWEFVGRGWGEDDELEVVGRWFHVAGLDAAIGRRV